MRIFPVGIADDATSIFTKCGENIRDGKLVAFPTETVYGLGANGLDKYALIRLFDAKQRPFNDPVILHVLDAEASEALWDISAEEQRVIKILQKVFWPGPLSIVARAARVIPREATAGSEFVAARSSAHPVARRLCRAAKCPIAGPSANPFGRISPTKASHVERYFHSHEIDLLECDDSCGVGIESTVVRVWQSEGIAPVLVEVLRYGAITNDQLSVALKDTNAVFKMPDESLGKLHIVDVAQQSQSPGQLLRHYSPAIPTKLLFAHKDLEQWPSKTFISGSISTRELSRAFLIDIVNEFGDLRDTVLQYYQVATDDSGASVARNLFNSLHNAEVEGLQQNCSFVLLGINVELMRTKRYKKQDLSGVYDRVFRAASGDALYHIP